MRIRTRKMPNLGSFINKSNCKSMICLHLYTMNTNFCFCCRYLNTLYKIKIFKRTSNPRNRIIKKKTAMVYKTFSSNWINPKYVLMSSTLCEISEQNSQLTRASMYYVNLRIRVVHSSVIQMYT